MCESRKYSSYVLQHISHQRNIKCVSSLPVFGVTSVWLIKRVAPWSCRPLSRSNGCVKQLAGGSSRHYCAHYGHNELIMGNHTQPCPIKHLSPAHSSSTTGILMTDPLCYEPPFFSHQTTHRLNISSDPAEHVALICSQALTMAGKCFWQ